MLGRLFAFVGAVTGLLALADGLGSGSLARVGSRIDSHSCI